MDPEIAICCFLISLLLLFGLVALIINPETKHIKKQNFRRNVIFLLNDIIERIPKKKFNEEKEKEKIL
jgi:hypothetical protein